MEVTRYHAGADYGSPRYGVLIIRAANMIKWGAHGVNNTRNVHKAGSQCGSSKLWGEERRWRKLYL